MSDSSDRTAAFNAGLKTVSKLAASVQADTIAELEALLNKAKAEIQAKLADAPSDFTQFHYTKISEEIASMEAALAAQSATLAGTGAEKIHAAGQQMVDTPFLLAGVVLDTKLPALDIGPLLSMKVFLTGKMKEVTTEMVGKINGELGLVLVGVKTPFQAAQAVADITNSSIKRGVTVVRTELGRVFSDASYKRMLQASAIIGGMEKQWRRSGKPNARPHHNAADGQIQPVDEPFIIAGHKLRYPRDPAAPASETINCGCTMMPRKPSWNMLTPDKKPFTSDELQRYNKQMLADAR